MHDGLKLLSLAPVHTPSIHTLLFEMTGDEIVGSTHNLVSARWVARECLLTVSLNRNHSYNAAVKVCQ